MKSMKRLIPTCALAAALAATAHAQDSTVTSRTQVKADDAKSITATGCLVPGLAPGVFTLRGGITARGEAVTSKSRVKTEVDKDEARVKSDTRTKADGGHDRVSSSTALVYDLSPRTGVDLASHVGQQVELTAIMLDRGKGDADVKIKEDTKVDRPDAPDGRARTETKLNVPRVAGGPRLTVLSVKQLAPTCS